MGWSYDTAQDEINGSLKWRWFCRIYTQPVPNHSTLRDREALIRELFPMVKKIARRISRMVPGSDLDDLVGEGCVGLIRAVDSFDPQRGPTLEHYARRICAGAMLNGIRRLDPVSERVRREIREAERERFALATQTGVMPSQREMEQRRPALRRARATTSRYRPLFEGSECVCPWPDSRHGTRCAPRIRARPPTSLRAASRPIRCRRTRAARSSRKSRSSGNSPRAVDVRRPQPRGYPARMPTPRPAPPHPLPPKFPQAGPSPRGSST